MQLKSPLHGLPLLTRCLLLLVLPAGGIAWLGNAFDLGEWLLTVVGTCAVVWLLRQERKQ